MSGPDHLVVRASAGTGKTYELSTRYLALLLAGVDPDRILATTFTRKAAHEILHRIVERLAEAASGRGVEDLARSIGRATSAEECAAVLERLLRGLHRVRVGTIDSFFAQLARLFSLDLGLPPGWRIGDEAEAELLRSEAIAEAVAQAGKLELLDLLRDFQRQSTGQGAHWPLSEFVGDGRAVLLESAPEAWSRVEALPDVSDETLEAAASALSRLVLPLTTKGKEHHHWVGSRKKVLDRLERQLWSELLEGGLPEKILAGEAEYSGNPIGPEHVAVLRPILDRALHVLTHRLATQNAAARALLERYEASYRRLARERGLLRFEDLPDALAPISGVDPLAARGVERAHRLDGRIDHVLLDEFQDTAPVQWRVLRELADSIVADESGERSFFCVGDEKQSIYGWRAAEPRLLRDLEKKRAGLKPKTLKLSYRSSRAVLGAVNLVFATIGENPAFEKADPEKIAAAREFQAAFPEHAPNEDRPGAAHLVRARVHNEGEPAHVPVLAAAVERVQGILGDAPHASIGILLRRRLWIPELIRRLRDAGIGASDEGGNPLTDSVAVLHALSLLHLADHPGDTAAAFHVADSPFGPRFGLDRGWSPADGRLGDVARQVRAALGAMGYGGFLASIRPSAGYDDWNRARYEQLVDLALAWESRAGSRPGAFVEHVRRTKVEDRSAAQVRVMTVHGAKGLQFDAVVLPELDRSMAGQRKTLLWMRSDPEGAIETVSHEVSKQIANAHPILAEVRNAVTRRDMLEELCVLYVAMTRAVHRLDLIVQGRDKESSALTYASILRKTFDVEAVGDAGVTWSHEKGTKPWFRAEIGPTEAESAPAPEGARRGLRLAPTRRPRSLATRSPSHAKDLERVSVSRLLQPRDSMTMRGRIAHALLEQVEWLDTFARKDEELIAIARKTDPDLEVARSAVADFRRWMGQPATRSLLTHPEADVEVWRERPFSLLLPDEKGPEVLWSGAFDRVVLRRESGRVVDAEIVDFKTDRVSGEAIAARAEIYRPQMEAYRRVLARMTALDGTRIRARLLFLYADAVVDV